METAFVTIHEDLKCPIKIKPCQWCQPLHLGNSLRLLWDCLRTDPIQRRQGLNANCQYQHYGFSKAFYQTSVHICLDQWFLTFFVYIPPGNLITFCIPLGRDNLYTQFSTSLQYSNLLTPMLKFEYSGTFHIPPWNLLHNSQCSSTPG